MRKTQIVYKQEACPTCGTTCDVITKTVTDGKSGSATATYKPVKGVKDES